MKRKKCVFISFALLTCSLVWHAFVFMRLIPSRGEMIMLFCWISNGISLLSTEIEASRVKIGVLVLDWLCIYGVVTYLFLYAIS